MGDSPFIPDEDPHNYGVQRPSEIENPLAQGYLESARRYRAGKHVADVPMAGVGLGVGANLALAPLTLPAMLPLWTAVGGLAHKAYNIGDEAEHRNYNAADMWGQTGLPGRADKDSAAYALEAEKRGNKGSLADLGLAMKRLHDLAQAGNVSAPPRGKDDSKTGSW
jgi:hypothetical protein